MLDSVGIRSGRLRATAVGGAETVMDGSPATYSRMLAGNGGRRSRASGSVAAHRRRVVPGVRWKLWPRRRGGLFYSRTSIAFAKAACPRPIHLTRCMNPISSSTPTTNASGAAHSGQ